MTQSTDVAIVGAGPHGLSLAAHLAAKGVNFRIFGKPMTTWSQRMPKNMILKSDGFATNLSAPAPDSTLKAWSRRKGLAYADQGLPIPLDNFLAYADWFQKRYVPSVEPVDVAGVTQQGEDFRLTLESGETLIARSVVLAVGITWFEHLPEILSALPAALRSHSAAHRDVAQFKGKDVAVIGAGSSAVDLAWLLHQQGAKPHIVARAAGIEYNKVPDASDESLLGRIQRPASGIGRGWRSLFCAEAPLLFYRLPQALKRRAIDSHMHPAAGWFMREKVEGVIPMSLGCTVAGAKAENGRVLLRLAGAQGKSERLDCDHVIAATGYRMDMRRLPFLPQSLVARIAEADGTPILSDSFETPIPKLYAVGPAALETFGPLMRFMVGAEFAAPRVAGRLERSFGASLRRAA
ncbi:MAG: NAD(P)/FAD-dependent oxidoreductase [Alphaproteobacteria bacterium]|nr:NAD(P)/FAD-dependent oxidoreductase [Alphaproteobacteria bacterium]MBV9693098.1 NAD(P)/FAD-dependent oxidoreductase [Alphaproteobacteria bacterium]